MEVTLDLSPQEDLERLDALLSRRGFKDYIIFVRVERRDGRLQGGAVVQFGNDRMRKRIARRYHSFIAWWCEPSPPDR
jgi:hypothetical protein